jgi:hypothetical protein
VPRQAHNNPVLIRDTAQEATKGRRSEGGEKRGKKGKLGRKQSAYSIANRTAHCHLDPLYFSKQQA